MKIIVRFYSECVRIIQNLYEKYGIYVNYTNDNQPQSIKAYTSMPTFVLTDKRHKIKKNCDKNTKKLMHDIMKPSIIVSFKIRKKIPHDNLL